MQTINDVLPLEHIFLDIEFNSKKQVFKKVASIVEHEQDDVSKCEIVESLFNREKLGSTVLDDKIAFPYCKYNKIKYPKCFLFRLQEAIDFDCPEGILVKLIIVFIIPENINITSKSLLLSLKDKLSKKEFQNILLSTNSLNEIYNMFNADI